VEHPIEGGSAGFGANGGAGGALCEILWEEDDPTHDGRNFTLVPLATYCTDRECPATSELAMERLLNLCGRFTRLHLITACGYARVRARSMWIEGYVFDEATGGLVGAYDGDDIPLGQPGCEVFDRYGGVRPEPCVDPLESDPASGPNLCSNGGAGGAGG
jgi:hypothetical protein